jgi:hypothetical protein
LPTHSRSRSNSFQFSLAADKKLKRRMGDLESRPDNCTSLEQFHLKGQKTSQSHRIGLDPSRVKDRTCTTKARWRRMPMPTRCRSCLRSTWHSTITTGLRLEYSRSSVPIICRPRRGVFSYPLMSTYKRYHTPYGQILVYGNVAHS